MHFLVSLLQNFLDWVISKKPFLPHILNERHRIPIIAHRGAHEQEGFKENTLEAFKWCVDHDIWGIEMDIRWTCDDIPIILHDPNCGRHFDYPDLFVDEVHFDELRKLVPDIPSFAEVLDLCEGKVHLMLELKTPLTHRQNQILAAHLESSKPVRDYHLLSLDPTIFATVRFAPKECFLPVAELNTTFISNLSAQYGWGGLCGYYLFLNDHKVEQHHHLRQKVGVGFINYPSTLVQSLEKGVDWIFTDRVVTLSEFVKHLPRRK